MTIFSSTYDLLRSTFIVAGNADFNRTQVNDIMTGTLQVTLSMPISRSICPDSSISESESQNLLRDVTNQLPWIFIDVDGTLVEPGKATPEKNVHSSGNMS